MHKIFYKFKLLFKKSYLLEIIFLSTLILIASWIYIKPILDMPNDYILLGGADDSTYGLLTQKILRFGIKGGYDLTFPPLLPILMAFFHKYLFFPIEDAGRLVTSIAIILTIIPTYLLARSLFGIKAAIIAGILLLTWPMSNLSFGFARPQALQTFIMATALLISLLALKKERYILYFSAGLFWGLCYLARFESWLPLTILLIFILLGIKNKKISANISKKFFITLAGFLVITYSYLSFVHESFGSWTINPRIGIDVIAPGGAFSVYHDSKGVTTLAQVMLSGEPMYYQYDLWHPNPRKWLIAFGRNKLFDSPIPSIYWKILNKYSPEIIMFSSIGLTISLLTVFWRKKRLLILTGATFFCFYSLSNLIMRMLGTLPLVNHPFIPDTTIELFKVTFGKYRDFYITYNLFILFASCSVFYLLRQNILPLLRFFHQNRSQLFIPIAIFVGNIPLFLHSVEDWYVMWLWPLLIIYAGFFVSKSVDLITTVYTNNSKIIKHSLSVCIILLSIFFLGRRTYLKTISTRDHIYKPTNGYAQSIEERTFKNTGLKILADYGSGARVAVFRTTSAFYAQGIPFFFISDNITPFEQIMDYFYKNKVDYIVAAKSEVFNFKNLRPLLNPETKLEDWKIFYIDPDYEKPWFSETETNIMVTVWKRK